jgi:hypothetical protein
MAESTSGRSGMLLELPLLPGFLPLVFLIYLSKDDLVRKLGRLYILSSPDVDII